MTDSAPLQQFSTPEDIDRKIKEMMPHATVYKENWAYKKFREYNDARNQHILQINSTELMVLNSIEEMSKGNVAFLLPLFINDIRKKDGSKFPGESLRQLISSLFHYFHYELKREWNFFKDAEFTEGVQALDACMKSATREGIGLYKKKASCISKDTEERLWTDNHLGT